MSDTDDRSGDDPREADQPPAPGGYDEATQSSQDRGHAGDADASGGSSDDRASDTRTAREAAGVGTFSSEHGIERDTQAGAGSLGETAQDGVGGFFTEPAEAAGLMPDPEGSDGQEGDTGADAAAGSEADPERGRG